MTEPRGSLSARVNRVSHRVTDGADGHRYWFLLCLSVLFFATTALRARATPFWHDEIYTILLSRLATVRDVWGAARDGADLMPPLNLLLTRVLEAPFGPGPISSRLPAMLGFWTMSVVVFSLVRARSNVFVACAAALLPWFTRAYRYSYEARGYGTMLGLFALLLWSWSEAAGGHRRRVWLPIFAAVCAASLWNHYFAVVTFVPIAAGEIYRLARRRSADWPLWIAAVTGLAACAPLVALARSASMQGATYWRHARWSDVGSTYVFLLHDLWSLDRWVIVVLAAATALGLLIGRFRLTGFPAAGYEVIAGTVALCIPAMAVGLGRITGAFAPRYALPGVVSFAIAAPLALWWLSRKSPVLEAVLLAVLLIGVARPSIDVFRHPPAFHDPYAERPILAEHVRMSPPVVVVGAVQFLELWYYASPDNRSRLWYIADPAEARRYLGSDTTDVGYIKLARRVPLSVRTYEELEDQESFTLYDDGVGWLPAKLRDSSSALTLVDSGRERGARVWHAMKPTVR